MLNERDYKKVVNYALSDTDIQTLLSPNTTNIISYPDLVNVNDINDIFDGLGRCVVFIPLSESFGHWCCLIKRSNSIEWFDPYSIKPDEEKKWINEQVLKRLHEDQPYLTNLLKDAYHKGVKILYNPYKWQADKANVSDCGRFVAWRCMNYNKTLKQLNTIISKSKLTPDEYVTNVTYNKLGK